VLLTWNIDKFIQRSGTATIPIADCPALDELLRETKAAHLLSDAEAAIYVVRGGKALQLMYRSSANPASEHQGWEFVPSQYRWLRTAIQGRDFVIINSGIGEQIVITSRAVLKWTGGQWTRLSHSSVSQLLPKPYSEGLKSLVLDIVGRLSQQHVGALIVLPKDLDGLLRNCATGLSKKLNGLGFLKLTPITRGFFERLCAIDGAVILSDDATVVDAGVLVNIVPGSSAEGARSTAAAAASKFGVAVKVSHDGPVTVFRDGQRIATVG
jgi:DNA integrity scanning protein DisA with diadenylate cyclase activity